MKNIFFCISALLAVCSLQAQIRYDSFLPEYCVDVNLKGGIETQAFTTVSFLTQIPSPLNPNVSKLKYIGGFSKGADIMGCHFFNKNRHWGVGLGLMYASQTGSLQLDNYHVEFKSQDQNFYRVFRQVITNSAPIKEAIKSTNINIPLVLKYKYTFKQTMGILLDAGIVYNVKEQNKYSTNAAFNYEAIYKFSGDQAVYDASVVPDATHDWLITQAQYSKTDPKNVNAIFSALQSSGYSVGLNMKPKYGGSGNQSYYIGSIGYIVKPSMDFMLNVNLYLDLGVYYIYQPFQSLALSNYEIINSQFVNRKYTYSSLLNSISNSTESTYGINIGLRYYFFNVDNKEQ